MNWMGGARSRICKADHKSKKSQIKLQKDYFERRRMGAINVNAIGKNAKRIRHPKETKAKVSQDILDFQNLKHHIEGVVEPDSARATFRVVHLNRKTSASKCVSPRGLSCEEVELPLSPVGVHSTLNLTHSPSSQDDNIETPNGKQTLTVRQSTSHYATSKKSSVGDLPENHKYRNEQLPSDLGLFGKPDTQNISHTQSSNRKSSLITLFGTTMKKPGKHHKAAVMLPPSTFGVTSSKARKKPQFPNPRPDKKRSSKSIGDSDYSIDDHQTGTRHKDFRFPSQHDETLFMGYSSLVDDTIQGSNPRNLLVPSQSSNILQDIFHRNQEDECNFDLPHSFKLFSPLRPLHLVSTKENRKAMDIVNSRSNYSNIDYQSDKINNFVIESINAGCYSPGIDSSSMSTAILSHKYGTQSQLCDRINNEASVPYVDKQPHVTDNRFCPDGLYYNQHVDDFQCREFCEGQFNRLTDSKRITSDTDDILAPLRPDISSKKSFKYCDDLSPSDASAFSAYRSAYHVKKIENSMLDGRVLVNQSLTAEWCNVSREQKDKSPTVAVSMTREQSHYLRPSLSCQDAHGVELFEPLQASTPNTRKMPICLNKQAMDRDVNSLNTVTANREKLYPVTDLLDEMMDLETQAQNPHLQLEKQLFNGNSMEQHETDDYSVVKETVYRIIARIEDIMQENHLKDMSDVLSHSNNKQTKSPSKNKLNKVIGNGINRKGVVVTHDNGMEENNLNSYSQNSRQSLDNMEGSVIDTRSLADNGRNNSSANKKLCTDQSKASKAFPSKDLVQSNSEEILAGASNFITSQPNAMSQCIVTPISNVIKPSLGPYLTQVSILPTCLHEGHSKSIGSMNESSQTTVSTQTDNKQFTNAATSPIVIFTCYDNSYEKDLEVENYKSSVGSKVYSLRSRTKLCDNEITKQEE